MAAYADRPLHAVLEDVAAECPAPGGGSSAAWACALAAGLVEMSAAFGRGRPGPDGQRARLEAVHARAGELRGEALALAERELDSYAPVLEALRLPRDDAERAGRVQEALGRAAEAPLAVAAAGAEVAELGVAVAAAGSPHLRGDAVAGVLLAEAACRAAAFLAELNLAAQPADVRMAQAGELVQRGLAAREAALR